MSKRESMLQLSSISGLSSLATCGTGLSLATCGTGSSLTWTAISSETRTVSVGVTSSIFARVAYADMGISPLMSTSSGGITFANLLNSRATEVFLPPSIHGGLIKGINSEFDSASRWRSYLESNFRNAKVSQRKFWNLVDYVFDCSDNILLSEIKNLGKPLSMDFRGSLQSGRDQIDHLDLSARHVRWIIDAAFEQLDGRNDFAPSTVADIVATTFAKGISKLAKRRIFVRQQETRVVTSSIRERVLSLSIRTGVSPPSDADCRPAVGWAFVSITPQMVENEKIQRQKNSRSLSDAVRERPPFARFNRSSRTNSRSRRSACDGGRRCSGLGISVEKCA